MSGIHLALLGMTYGGSVTVIQSFTATGEWVCPTGVTEVEWLVVAGGGGGGGWRWWAATVAQVVALIQQVTVDQEAVVNELALAHHLLMGVLVIHQVPHLRREAAVEVAESDLVVVVVALLTQEQMALMEQVVTEVMEKHLLFLA
jgi:hypothetical protein